MLSASPSAPRVTACGVALGFQAWRLKYPLIRSPPAFLWIGIGSAKLVITLSVTGGAPRAVFPGTVARTRPHVGSSQAYAPRAAFRDLLFFTQVESCLFDIVVLSCIDHDLIARPRLALRRSSVSERVSDRRRCMDVDRVDELRLGRVCGAAADKFQRLPYSTAFAIYTALRD